MRRVDDASENEDKDAQPPQAEITADFEEPLSPPFTPSEGERAEQTHDHEGNGVTDDDPFPNFTHRWWVSMKSRRSLLT